MVRGPAGEGLSYFSKAKESAFLTTGLATTIKVKIEAASVQDGNKERISGKDPGPRQEGPAPAYFLDRFDHWRRRGLRKRGVGG